jgi:bifunctional UDP-N-acetylglucosamine pyrophosphorylase/glucosamine-1-phosphate N-acetyltransferase
LLVLNADTPLLTSGSIARLIEHHLETRAVATVLTPGSWASEHAVAYSFEAAWLWPRLAGRADQAGDHGTLSEALGIGAYGEGIAVLPLLDEAEAIDVDDRVRLAEAEQAMRQRICRRLMLSGVTIIDPATAYIDDTATIGEDTVVYPNTMVLGRSVIGPNCHIGPNSHVEDSMIGERCRITASTVHGAELDSDVDVGPYSHLRPGAHLSSGVYIGNYVEVKNSGLGRDTKVGHFSYIGDAVVGANVNIGAGTVTCNFDGVDKHQTIIEDDVFVGSDTMLVAPVRVGRGAKTGAGAVVTHDVSPGTLVVGVPARVREHHQIRQ